MEYSIKEIRAELENLDCILTKRNASLSGSDTYKVIGGNFFFPSLLYTKSDLVKILFTGNWRV